jgi:hypothetical protein
MQFLHRLLIRPVLGGMATQDDAQPSGSAPAIPLASSYSRAKSIPASCQGRDGGATAAVLEVEALVGVIDRQAVLTHCRRLCEKPLLALGVQLAA